MTTNLHETLRGGQAWSRRLSRHQRLRLRDVEGGACVSALFYNARDPIERYNMPDTLKAQFTAFLTTGRVLYSDMGRILCSIVADDCGWHDTLSGDRRCGGGARALRRGSVPGAAQRLPPQRTRQPAGRAGQTRPRQAGRRLERELLRPRRRRRDRGDGLEPGQQPRGRVRRAALRDGYAGGAVEHAAPAGSVAALPAAAG